MTAGGPISHHQGVSSDHIEALAELLVRFGANVQPGQVVAIGSEPGKEALTRAIAVHAYKAGAKFVDVSSYDLHIKRARALLLELGREENAMLIVVTHSVELAARLPRRCELVDGRLKE